MNGPVYHWILTCTWTDPDTGGTAVREMSGATEVLPGMTRSTVYREIRQTAAIQSPAIPRNAMCVFFALEPNDLVGGAQ
jgi:hypothetical protein